MSKETFYLPIKSVNLPHYFVKGIICPVKYIQNRNIDLQNRFENQLLFSSQKFTSETNCSLEIVLNETSESPTSISKNLYIYPKPLPISRVKKVIFQDEKQKLNTQFSVNSGGAFLPDNLLEVEKNDEILDADELVEIKPKEGDNNTDWTKKIDLFSRLMGGFALMRIAGDSQENYSSNYFHLLSTINDFIGNELKIQEIPKEKEYGWVIRNDGKQKEFYETIYSKVTRDTVVNFAENEKVSIQTKNGRIIVNKEQSRTYLVNILASYGEGARMNLDSFISDFNANKFEQKRKEGIALMFGLNKGYDAFRNSYKTQNFETDVKFKLDSQLDYYIIESIYQYVINDKLESQQFDYLDSWCIKSKDSKPKVGYVKYDVLDRSFYYKKREVGYSDSFRDFFDKLSQKDLFRQKYNDLINQYGTNLKVVDLKKALNDLIYLVYEEGNTNSLNQNKSNQIKTSKKVEYETLSPENDNILMVSEPASPKYKITNHVNSLKPKNDNRIIKRKKELEKLNITNLKKEGKKAKVKRISSYKNTPQYKQALIAEILKAEFN